MSETFIFTDATPASGVSILLDAVNEVLASIGEPPAQALDTGGTSEVAEAEDYLIRESKRIQAEGWYCNTLKNQTLVPDGSDHIDMTGVLKMLPVSPSAGRQVTIRNGRLYDLEANVDTFTQNVTLDMTVLLSFVNLPEKLRVYVIRSTCIKFERYKKRGQLDEAILQGDSNMARVFALQEDSDLRRTNVLNTPEMIRARGQRHDESRYWDA